MVVKINQMLFIPLTIFKSVHENFWIWFSIEPKYICLYNFSWSVCIFTLTFELVSTVVQWIKMDEKSFVSDLLILFLNIFQAEVPLDMEEDTAYFTWNMVNFSIQRYTKLDGTWLLVWIICNMFMIKCKTQSIVSH